MLGRSVGPEPEVGEVGEDGWTCCRRVVLEEVDVRRLLRDLTGPSDRSLFVALEPTLTVRRLMP